MRTSVDQVWQFFLQDNGPHTVASLSTELNLASRTVQTAVGELTTRGKLIRSKQGVTPYYQKKSKLHANLDALPEDVAKEVASLRGVGLGYPQIVKFLNDRDGTSYTVAQLKKQRVSIDSHNLDQLVALARLGLPITTSSEILGMVPVNLSHSSRALGVSWAVFEGGTNRRQRYFFHLLELALMKNDILAYRDLRALLASAFPDGVPTDWGITASENEVLNDEEEAQCSDAI